MLATIAEVPRWRFVPEASRAEAWADRALPISAGQTISQPYMVALMTQELSLTGDETVLEIGTGSGYQAAILSRLCRRVVTIERIPELSLAAKEMLESLGCTNVECLIGDGSLGCAEQAPFDRIIVTAGAPKVPPALCEQLAPVGRLVIPTGTDQPQMLQVVTRTPLGMVTTDVCPCSFVPLIGAAAWSAEES